MAEGNQERYPGQEKYPGQDVGQYSNGYSVPPPSQNYSPPQQPIYPVQQNPYMQPFPSGMQFPTYQNNMYHYGPQARIQPNQFENGQYYTSNQPQGSLPFDNRTSMQFQPNYVMYSNVRPSTDIPPPVYDNSYTPVNANQSYGFSSREYSVQGASSQDWQNNKHQQNRFQSMNNEPKFTSVTEGTVSDPQSQDWQINRHQNDRSQSMDNSETIFAGSLEGNASSSLSQDWLNRSQGNSETRFNSVTEENPGNASSSQSQDWQSKHQNKSQSMTNSEFTPVMEGATRKSIPNEKKGSPEASGENPKTKTKESSPEYRSEKRNENAYEDKQRKKDSSEYTANNTGGYEGNNGTGARNRDQGWGRRGRGGRRGNPRYYDPDKNNYNFESQEEIKRGQDNAVAETAAFMKSLGGKKNVGNASSAQDTGVERRGGRGGRGRYDRGGRGNRGYQQYYNGEDKQGKEWANRQARIEKEKDYHDMQNMYTRQNRGMPANRGGQRYYDRTYNTGNYEQQGKRNGQSRNGPNGSRTFERTEKEFSGQESKEDFKQSSPVGSGRMARGRGRGRTQESKLWDNSIAAAFEHSLEKQNSRQRFYDDQNSRPSDYDSSTNFQNVEDKEPSHYTKKSTQNQGKKENHKQQTQKKGIENQNPKQTQIKKSENQSTEDEETQRDRLSEQLTKGTYECMVCCDRIKQQQAIWSCISCFNCFHLGCIKKWAKSSTGEGGWRCPACQGATPKVPNAYMCFCGKVREPEWNRRDLAHSCGEVCGRLRKIEWCKHKCNILCHPGPCPPCTAYIKRSCACGALSRDVKCSVTEPYLCGGTCGKLLNCQGHKCEKICHADPCGDCQKIIKQTCYCEKSTREVACNTETFSVSTYSCEDKCSRVLECGKHQCESTCHPGDCKPCQKAVNVITHCPCGKVPLEKLYERDGAKQRVTCTDQIPMCNQPCQLKLLCGVPGAFHQCQALCHEGPCPPCPLKTPVRCRCGSMDCDIQCSELTTKADEATCKKPCKKLRHCGRHKCNTKCCIDVDHMCTFPCGRMLSCGLHKCEESCHRGNCPRCWQTSFDELTCHCGASVMYPPVPCGTKPPVCDNPCRRPQSCPHTASHLCHPEEPCPPCTMLIDKPCFGGHKIMRKTLCYLKAVSCGGVCDKPLPCGLHQCNRVCHEPPCVGEDNICPQKCMKPRESCGHPCANACHSGLCPDNNCKEMVKISCQCGLRKMSLQCSENDREYRAVATSKLASQMQNLNSGCSVDLSDIFTATARPDKLKRLPCNEECQTEERNRRLALALQIENPESREKLGTSSLYSDFMKEEARKDPNLAKTVHAALNELVMKSKESKQKSCIHSFPKMNRDKRHFVHEYCEHFGCKSESYDEEPNKNVVATAVKGMCYLPPVSVLEQLQREKGQRKVPAPVWSHKSSPIESSQGMQKLEKTRATKKEPSPPASKSPPIDYFDFEN